MIWSTESRYRNTTAKQKMKTSSWPKSHPLDQELFGKRMMGSVWNCCHCLYKFLEMCSSSILIVLISICRNIREALKTSRKWLTVAIFRKWQDGSVALWIDIVWYGLAWGGRGDGQMTSEFIHEDISIMDYNGLSWLSWMTVMDNFHGWRSWTTFIDDFSILDWIWDC